jgi:hypothetical protein
VAGGSISGYSGDGGSSIGALINGAFAVAVDSAGNLFIADTQNRVVRKVTATPAPMAFASTAVGTTSTDSPGTVTVGNTGTAPLNFAVPASAINPAITAGYTLGSSGTCPQISVTGHTSMLAAGTSCTEVVSFHPVAVSTTNTGSLTLTDDNLNVAGSTQAISLSGISTGTTGIVTPNILLTIPTTVTSGATVGGTVVFSSSSTSTPTGDVTIYAVATGSTVPVPLKTVASSAAAGGSGVAFSFTAPTTAGTYTIYASYAGDANFNNALSSNAVLTVVSNSTLPTTLNLSAPATVTAGKSFIVTSTLATQATATAAITGNVILSATPAGGAATVVATMPASQVYISGGKQTSVTLATSGSYTLSAAYAGDANFAAAANSIGVKVESEKGTVTLNVYAPAGEVSGTAITGTVSAVFSGSTATPTGSVVVTAIPINGNTNPSVVLGTYLASTLATAGAPGVSLPYTAPAAGFYNVTATYVGDTNYDAATPSFSTINVSAAAVTPTSMTLAVPLAAATGVPFDVTLVLTPAITRTTAITGAISITRTDSSGTTVLITTVPASQAVMTGGAKVSLTIATDGYYSLQANYAGDAAYGPSSAVVTNKISINSANSTLTVTGPANSFVGQPLQYTVILSQIAGVPGADITLTSSVNGVAGPGATVNSTNAFSATGAVATLTFSSAGVYTITASYPGGGGLSGIPNLPATSTPITTTIIVSGSKPAFNMTLDDSKAGDPATTPLYVSLDNAVVSTGLTLTASGGYNTPVQLTFSSTDLPKSINVALQDASGKTISSTTPVTAGTKVTLSFSTGPLATAARPIPGDIRLPFYFAGGLLCIGLIGRAVRSRTILRGLHLFGLMLAVGLAATTLAACDATDCAPKHDGNATVTITAVPTTTMQGAASQTVTVSVNYSYSVTQ